MQKNNSIKRRNERKSAYIAFKFIKKEKQNGDSISF